jgi:hypothetical protein
MPITQFVIIAQKNIVWFQEYAKHVEVTVCIVCQPTFQFVCNAKIITS